MNPYLVETKAAVTDLFATLNRERLRLNSQLHNQSRMRDYARELFEHGKAHGWSGELMIEWAGFEQSAADFESKAAETIVLVENLRSAHSAIAGAILQIAKQGISFIYGPLGNCPIGRAVGSQHLSNVIWQGRNQSMHYEEGANKPATIACFAALEADFGPGFQLGRTNLAAEVLRVLGWVEYEVYEADMATLLP